MWLGEQLGLHADPPGVRLRQLVDDGLTLAGVPTPALRRVARVSETPADAWGHALVTLDETGAVLDAWFPAPALGSPDGSDAPAELTALAGPDDVRRVTREVRLVEIADLQSPPASTEDAWLRLHLLSHRLVRPRTISMEGIFGRLTNVVWTSAGPCAVAGFEQTRARLMATGQRVTVFGVDKFPRMVDYVLPTGVRIGDADRVRLGAHLAEGTTVMHEGFVNYNAGRSGPRWSRAGSPHRSWSTPTPTSAAAPRSWAPSPAAAPR